MKSNYLTIEMLKEMIPDSQVKELQDGVTQLFWSEMLQVEGRWKLFDNSITFFRDEADLLDARFMAGSASDIQFCGNFRFSRTFNS